MVKYQMERNRFGDRLRQARDNKGLKQPELANMLGISQQRYSPWEVGKEGKQIEPSYDMLIRLAGQETI